MPSPNSPATALFHTDNRRVLRKRYRHTYSIGHGRDYQRSKVYKWDAMVRRKLWDDNDPEILTQEQAQTLADTIYSDCGVDEYHPAPSVEITAQKRSYSTYKPTGTRVQVPPHHIRLAEGWGDRLCVVLHEIAHALTASLQIDEAAWHGPLFVSVLMDLYTMYHSNAPKRSDMLSIAQEEGVDVANRHLLDMVQHFHEYAVKPDFSSDIATRTKLWEMTDGKCNILRS